MLRTSFLLATFTVLVGAQSGPLPEKVTWSEHVARLVFDNCSSCHRPGEAAPFALLDYESTKKRGRFVKRVTARRYMPPWHPVEGWGHFKDSRRMSDRDIALIGRWVDQGMPRGDAAGEPKPPEFPAGWQLGEPDLVVSMAKAYPVPADGPDIYRNFVVPLEIPEDKWVKALEIRPSARSVVHHSLFYLDDSGAARRSDGRNGTPGFRGMGFRRSGSLGGWAVGAQARKLPGDLAMPLPSGSDLVLSTHFHPSGKAEKERTTVGFFFTDEAPSRTLVPFQVPPVYGRLAGLEIPPGEKDFRISDRYEVAVDIDLISVGGHAHYLCRSMKAIATLPDGKTKKKLFHIADWDFNWQGRYEYAEPVRLPKGTVIEAELVYDNSADNPANPHDPPKHVGWGLESTDEMGSVIFAAVPVQESDLRTLRRSFRQQRRDAGRRYIGLAMRYDRDGDGKVTREEVPEGVRRMVFMLDMNRDGVVEKSEVEAAQRMGGRRRRR